MGIPGPIGTQRSHLIPALVCMAMVLAACGSTEASLSTAPSIAPASAADAPSVAPSASPSASLSAAAGGPVPHQPLAAGTYSSGEFATSLTYTVPDGWKMFEDEAGQYGLAMLANDGPCLCVWRDVSAAAASCAAAPEPGVGGSAADIVTWLAGHDGLDTSVPQAATIGGLDGFVIDVAISPDWEGTCPFSGGQPIVMTLVGGGISAGVHWGTDAGSSQRYYVLDIGDDGVDGNIAITVEVCCGVEFDERMAAATPVIESLVFGGGG